MNNLIIGIAGGSGSGKSTFTNRLKGEFDDNITVLYHDNYYKSRDGISFDERKKINYDSPDAFETSLLIEHIKELKKGNEVKCPIYDYSIHSRSADITIVKPSKVIVVEGILILQNEELRNLFDIKIFVDADADERILRRLLRDTKERGRNVESVVNQYLATVKPMHYMFVEPTKAMADIVINSGLNDVAFDLIKTKIRSFGEDEKEK